MPETQEKISIEQELKNLEAPIEGDEVKGLVNGFIGKYKLWRNPIDLDPTYDLFRALKDPKVKDLLSGQNKDPHDKENVKGNLRGLLDKAQKNYNRQFQKAKDVRQKHGVKVADESLEELTEAWKKLRKAESIIEQFETGKKREAPAPQPAPTPPPSPPPPPPKPTPPPSPEPITQKRPPAPEPPQPKQKTPEQLENEKKLKELEDALKEQDEKHKEEHKEFDPVMDKFKDLLRQMGQSMGLNDFKEPAQDNFPPQHQKELSPSMDERKSGKEAKEKGAGPLFTIEPPLAGYFRSVVFDAFDINRMTWIELNLEADYPYTDIPTTHTIRGKIKGKIALPLPKDYIVNSNSLQYKSTIKTTWDEARGIIYLESLEAQEFSIGIAKTNRKPITEKPKAFHTEDIITGDLGQRTTDFLAKVVNLPLAQRAIKIAEYTQNLLEYSNDSTYNFIYKSDPKTYYQKIEEHKKADCDVANGYFVALCRRAGIPARLVAGHHVSGSKQGKSEINAGTGHAWAEVWNGQEWLTIDATPPGQEEKEGEKLDPVSKQENPDLKTNPRPKDHPHNKSQIQKQGLKDAKELNDEGALEKEDLEALQEHQNEVVEEQEKEIVDKIEENKDLLDKEADRLEKQGRSQEAEEIRDKAKDIQKTLEDLKQNRHDPDKKEAVKKALEEANEVFRQKNFKELSLLKLSLMRQRKDDLKHRAIINKETDIYANIK